MLNKFSRIVLVIIVVFVLSVIIPEYYWKMFESKIQISRVNYSPILKNFILSKFENNEIISKDMNGRQILREEFEELTPFRSYRQLIVDGKFPNSIQNIPMDVQEVRKNNVNLYIRPFMIDIPQTQLFPLLESESGRVKLEMPDDYFRITDKIEFINCAENKIDNEKSREFNDTLINAGFQFPPKYIAGNVSTMKPFDEGYFIVDNANKIFHLKQVKGKPLCKKTDIEENLDVVHIAVQENELREFYGVLITRDNSVYLISYDNYKLIKIPLNDYNYKTTKFYLSCNLFYRTISLTGDNKLDIIVTDRDYKIVDNFHEPFNSKYETSAGKFIDYIFPYSLSLTNENSPYIDFYFRSSLLSKSIVGTAISLLFTFVLFYRRKLKISDNWFDIVIVLFTGIYGFISILAIKNND